MAHKFDEYNPRLLITDHFNKIQNELDIKVETILHKNYSQLNEKERIEINTIREKQINKIEEICESNISKWPENFDRQNYELEWGDLFNGKSLTEEQKKEKIKESIIKSDVILVGNPHLETKASLWVMPFFVDELNLKLAK